MEICFKSGHYAYIQSGFQSVCQVSCPISEDIIIKFVIYCADILHLKWNTIKLYLAGVQFHFIKAGYGKPWSIVINYHISSKQYADDKVF